MNLKMPLPMCCGRRTGRALEQTRARTLVIGGGVSANTHIRRTFAENMRKEYPGVALRIPSNALTTDNAIMIALAGFYRARRKSLSPMSSPPEISRSLCESTASPIARIFAIFYRQCPRNS